MSRQPRPTWLHLDHPVSIRITRLAAERLTLLREEVATAGVRMTDAEIVDRAIRSVDANALLREAQADQFDLERSRKGS